MTRNILAIFSSLFLLSASIFYEKLWAYLLVGFIVSTLFSAIDFHTVKRYCPEGLKDLTKNQVTFAVSFLWLRGLIAWPGITILRYVPTNEAQ